MKKENSSDAKSKLLNIFFKSLAAFFGFLLLVLASGVLLLNIKEQPLPSWAQTRISSEISKLTGSHFKAGKVLIGLENGVHPFIAAEKIELHSARIGISKAEQLRLRPNLKCAFRLQLCSEHITGRGLALSAFRNPEGQIYVGNGPVENGGAYTDNSIDFSHFLGTVKKELGKSNFKAFSTLHFTDISLSFFDLKTGESWKTANGRLDIAQKSHAVTAQFNLPLLHGDQISGALKFSLEHPINGDKTHFAATLSDLSLKDISAQTDALLWLRTVETYADASVSGILAENGKIIDFKGDIILAPGRILTEKFGAVNFDTLFATFGYDFQKHQLDVFNLRLATPQAFLKARATAALATPNAPADTISAQIVIEELSLPKSDKNRTEIHGSSGEFDLLLKQDPLRIELVQGTFQLDDAALSLSGDLTKKAGGLDIALDITSPKLSVKNVKAFWPIGLKENALGWIKKNTSGGMLHNVDVDLRITPDGKASQSTIDLDIIDMEMIYVPGLPRLTEIGGRLEIKDDTLFMDIYKGRIKTGQNHFVSAAGTRVRLDELKIQKNPATVDLKMTGEVPAFLRLLDAEPLALITKKGLSTDLASGKSAMHAVINFKLAKKIKMADIAYSFGGKIQNISSRKLVKGHLVEADFLTVSGDNRVVKISGDGVLDKIPFTAEWTQKLNTDTADYSEIAGNFEFSNKTLEVFKIPLPANILSGTGHADFVALLRAFAPPDITLRSNLRGIGLSLEKLDWLFGKKTQGELVAELSLGTVPRLKNLTLNAKDLTAQLSADFHKNATLKSLNLAQLKIKNRLDISAEITRKENGDLILTIAGEEINLANLPQSQEFTESDFSSIIVNVDKVKLADGIVLGPLQGVFETTLGLQGAFTAQFGKGQISGEITPTPYGFAALITSDDAAPLFAELGVLKTMVGGDMALNVISRASDDGWEGTFSVTDFRIIEAPILLQILSDLSIVGLLEKLGGAGIAFSQMKAEFNLSEKRFSLPKASLEGASLGLAGHGFADFSTKRLDFDLIVSPLYALNIPLKGRGEGIFGFAAKVDGPFSQPVVSVNPLIGILPWPLRDLFLKKYKN